MMLLTTICISLIVATTAEKARHPKLFFVSSSSTTTTLSTTTLCYSTTNTGFTTTACTGKRKRAIYTDPETGVEGSLDLEDLIKPQMVNRDDVELEGGKADDETLKSSQTEYEREGKFMLYWKTTTSTSTATTYTATTTIGGLGCTPSGFTISQCPSNGKK